MARLHLSGFKVDMIRSIMKDENGNSPESMRFLVSGAVITRQRDETNVIIHAKGLKQKFRALLSTLADMFLPRTITLV